MGDDPYDFDIAIPSRGHGGYAGGSDDGSASAASGASRSDAEDERRAAGRREGLRGATATKTAGGGSALDKAKSFLSKYAAKTPSRSRRVEMSLDDDDDLSLDSSGDASETPAKATRVASDDEASESYALSEESAAPVRVVASTSRQRDESDGSDDDEHEDERPVTKTAAVAVANARVPTVKPQPVESDEDEVQSVASQSDADDSADVRRDEPVAARTVQAASESGVYEDEGFEEASANAAGAEKTQPPVARSAVAQPAEEDSHVNYSLDFVDDGELPSPTDRRESQHDTQPHRDDQENDRRSIVSSSSSRNRDSYVDEDESEGAGDQAAAPATEDREEDLQRSHTPEDSNDYGEDDRFDSESVVVVPNLPAVDQLQEVKTEQVPVRRETFSAGAGVAKMVESTASSANDTIQLSTGRVARPHVQIVREYEQNTSPVDKRDASTQFTGNHASIQTDLTPDGMTTAAERRQSREQEANPVDPQPPHPLESVRLPSAPASTESTAPAPTVLLPPPPPFSSYGLYDPLQLPTATSMSIYKQQLLALQQQIHQKKQETEQLFRERLATRYSTLRGTDTFISSNRPPRMQLWEALMRVDPSLDERRAKEVARRASEEL